MSRIFNIAISVSPHVCFILDLILISMFQAGDQKVTDNDIFVQNLVVSITQTLADIFSKSGKNIKKKNKTKKNIRSVDVLTVRPVTPLKYLMRGEKG